MSTSKNIFNNQKSLTEQELRDYLDGKLTKQQQREVELKMQASSLNEEAFEGFSENPEVLQNVWRLKTKVNLRTERLSGNSWNFKYTLVAAGITGIVMLLAGKYFLFNNDALQSEKTLVAEVVKKESTANESISKDNFIEELEAIEEAEIIPSEEQITSEDVADNTPITLHLSEDTPAPARAEAIETEFKLSLQMSNKKSASVRIEMPEEDAIVKSNMPTLYINGLLVIDYSKVYNNNTDDALLSGTPAKYKTLADTSLEKSSAEPIEEKEFDYNDYLSISLNKYKQDKYKAALKNFLTILNQYPEDLNAHFYGGLCFYNIGNPTKAMEFFDYILTHDYNTFYQEAQYYKALCLQRMGEYGKANLLLQKIVAQKGFFAEQAKANLEKQK